VFVGAIASIGRVLSSRKELVVSTRPNPRSHRGRTALAAAAIAVAALVVTAGAALAFSGSRSHANPKTLHFLLRETQQVLDRAPAGPSNGDLVLVRGDLLDPKTRAAVGTEIGSYVMVDAAHENRSLADIVFTPDARTRLAKADQLALETIFDSVPGSQIAPITGGSGRYQGARGEVVATDGPDGLIDIVIHLRSR